MCSTLLQTYFRSWAHNQSLAVLDLDIFNGHTWDKCLDGVWTSSGSPLILIHIQISLAVGPHGECLIGLDWYTFFYRKGMEAFTGQSKSVFPVINTSSNQYIIYCSIALAKWEFFKLFQAIQRGDIKCNLQGAGIGNGWVSGLDSIISVAPMLFHMVNV